MWETDALMASALPQLSWHVASQNCRRHTHEVKRMRSG